MKIKNNGLVEHIISFLFRGTITEQPFAIDLYVSDLEVGFYSQQK